MELEERMDMLLGSFNVLKDELCDINKEVKELLFENCEKDERIEELEAANEELEEQHSMLRDL